MEREREREIKIYRDINDLPFWQGSRVRRSSRGTGVRAEGWQGTEAG